MPRAPRPAATTSTLARNPALDAEDGVAGDVIDPDLDEAEAADDRQLPVPGTDAAEVAGAVSAVAAAAMASHPPEEQPPRRRGPAPGSTRRPRTSTAAAPAPVVPAQRVDAAIEPLTDRELQDLGALTRLAMKFGMTPAEMVGELEPMLAAYRRAAVQL